MNTIRYKTILAFTLLTISGTIFGQNEAELDKKKGFRDFILGQDFSIYRDRVWLTKVDEEKNKNKKVKEYSLKDEIIVQELSFMVTLSFFENKLTQISVYRITKNEYEFSAIKQSLFTLYGNVPNYASNPNKPSDLKKCDEIYLWSSETVGLELVYCNEDPPFLIEFSYWDKKRNLKLLKDEF